MEHGASPVAVGDRNQVVVRSGRVLEVVRRQDVVLAVRIRRGVRIDGLHGLEGVIFELDVGGVELGVFMDHCLEEGVDGAGGGDVVGEEADWEEELAGAAGADGAADAGAFVVGDGGVGEGGVVVEDGVKGEEGGEIGEGFGFAAGVVEVEEDDGLLGKVRRMIERKEKMGRGGFNLPRLC